MINRTEQDIMKNWQGDATVSVVSICTITYNHEAFVAEALDSFLMQETDFPFEIVIDDDCSTDNNAKVIQPYIDKYPNIFNANLRSVNVGMQENGEGNLKRAKGKYIALCEGDDYWTDPLKLQKQVDFLEGNEGYSMVFHNAELHDYFTDGTMKKSLFNELVTSCDYSADMILDRHSVATASVVFRNLKQYKYLEKNFWFPVGDTPLFITCAAHGKVYYMVEVMSVYRRVLGGMMKSAAFQNIKTNPLWIRYYKQLYADYSYLIAKKTIDKHLSIIYQNAGIEKKIEKKHFTYMKYLWLAFKSDPYYIINIYFDSLLNKFKKEK